MTADELRNALAANEAALGALASDDFAGRFALQAKSDELRSELHDLIADDLNEASSEWAERAGRKGEHEQPDLEVYAAVMNKNGSFAGPG